MTRVRAAARRLWLPALLASSLHAAPNVVLISVDTLRADRLPAYGYRAIRTPHLDRFRADAVLFERAWSHTPLTAPAHASMLTGLLPAQHGIRDNSGFALARGVRTVADQLAGHGYATAAIVSCKVLSRDTGLSRGFAVYDEQYAGAQRKGADTVAAAIRWLDARKKGPWLLFLHLYEPHTPYEKMAGIADAYDAEVVRSDALTGRFLDELRRRKLYDDALIVFTSDHGEGLGDHVEKEHGVLLYRETLQVPLIVKLPRNQFRGRTVAADAQLIDVAPTILQQAGIRPAVAPPGVSLASLAVTPRARTIYAETFYPRYQLGWHELRSVIAGGKHLIAGRGVELYDLARDPRETADLSDTRRREAQPLLAELRRFSAPVSTPSPSGDTRSLAALGYLSGGTGNETVFHPDPRHRIRILTPVLRLTTALRREQYAAALRITEEILAAHPEYVEIWERKAMALLGLGREREAREAVQEAMRRGKG